MQLYEYKVVPAPKKGKRAKGVRGAEDRFAAALSDLMNQMGAEGWEYQRSDTLPCETRAGLTGKSTVFQNMLIFRRAAPVQEEAPSPVALAMAEIAERPAPPLPSPAAANALPDTVTPVATTESRDLAAE